MLQKLKKVENLDRYKVRYYKEIYHLFLPQQNSVPVFIFGKQRSGTTMLQYILEYSKHFRVYGAHHPKAFDKDVIKDFETVKELLHQSRLPFTAFTPLRESHRILEFLETFPNGKSLWIFRNFMDSVNSAVRLHPNTGRTIENLCRGNSQLGHSAEGMSDEIKSMLQKIYKPQFTKYDYSSLIWWSRNMLVLDKKLSTNEKVLLINYERLVRSPRTEGSAIFNFLGAPYEDRCVKYVHSRSIQKNLFPEIDESVKALCLDLSDRLEKSLRENRLLHNLPLAEK